jgi:hypothetical protein
MLMTHVVRRVRAGGATKIELLARLADAHIQLNQTAHDLFADPRFTTSATSYALETIECSVAELGLACGGTFAQVLDRAISGGLSVCPLEIGPHLRLQLRDQAEGCLGSPPSRHRAPPGSITVASPALANDEQTPRGFYLRRIEGVLWLRGYRCGADHVWSPEDIILLARTPTTRRN